MKTFEINLFDKETEFGFMPTLKAYLLEDNQSKRKRPAVVVIPGGGYENVSMSEGERIALSYTPAGFQTFVLKYCVLPHRQPMALKNIAKAIEIIRKKAEEWNVDAEKIAVCGFSAGGHLAASIATLWNDEDVFGPDKEQNIKHRPNASILCYPVITSGEYAHKGSFQHLIGSEDEEIWKKYSLENQVDIDTPPAFLWHTFEDKLVPVENSFLYAQALRKKGIPLEMHIYPNGPHGLDCVSEGTFWKVPKYTRKYPWIEQSIEWLYLTFGITSIEK